MTEFDVLLVEPHPLLRVHAFSTTFPAPLSDVPTPDWLVALLRPDSDAPFRQEEAVRVAVRDALRHAGYKPTGRGKPASEYLVRAAAEGTLASINPAVDACNAVSLHGGFPISVVDAERARPPYRIASAGAGDRYVFNAAGQEIDLAGLVCLWDADGPCANAVKDSQRTKTHGGTRRTLTVLWGVAAHDERARAVVAWYRTLLAHAGAVTVDVIAETTG